MAAVEKAIAKIVTVQLKQGLAKDYPELLFATGNIGQGHLSGKQKYAHIFVVYLALLKTEVFNMFGNKKGKTPKSKKETKKKYASTPTTGTKEVIEKEVSPTGTEEVVVEE